jgi:hypothetical protein
VVQVSAGPAKTASHPAEPAGTLARRAGGL